MILHFSTDNIFIDYAIKQFETIFPGGNTFLIEVPSAKTVLKHVDLHPSVIPVVPGSEKYNEFVNSFDTYRLIIFHSLNGSRIQTINKSNGGAALAWIPWGSDLFTLNEKLELYQHLTRKKIYSILLKQKIERFVQDVYHIIRLQGSKSRQKKKAIKKLNYFFSREDSFNVVTGINLQIKRFDYFYYSIEETLGDNIDKSVLGNNILIGNSATPSNNHFDIFNSLRNFKLRDQKIFVPLSYGNKNYGVKVAKSGSSIFGQNFNPLQSFLPINEYNKIISSCRIVIMNHNRPQAFGNILTALWLGAEVYLNETNTLLNFFRNLGIHLFSIENDLLEKRDFSIERLSAEMKRHNRNILYSTFSKEATLSYVRNIIEEIK